MNALLEEEMGGMITCDKVCLGMVLTSSPLSCDKWIPSGGSVFSQIREVQRNPLSAFAAFSSAYSSK